MHSDARQMIRYRRRIRTVFGRHWRLVIGFSLAHGAGDCWQHRAAPSQPDGREPDRDCGGVHPEAADVQENEIGMSPSSLELPSPSARSRGRPQSSPLFDPRDPGPDPRGAARAGAAGRPGTRACQGLRPGAAAAREQPAAEAVRGEPARPGPRPARDPGHDRQEVQGSTPTGWPTISTSSTRCCARSVRTSRAATTRCCRSWSGARSRATPGLRPGPGAGRPHRQRARRDEDHAVRPGVPGGRAPDDRRALGPAHDASPGPAREPAAAGRADALGLGRAPAGRAVVPGGQGCHGARLTEIRGVPHGSTLRPWES